MHADLAIIGTGFAGLGAAIRLKQEGFEDFVVFERAGEVGGVWRDNRYPGCACDTASHLYSFSFAPKADWSRRFASRGEILAYLKRCATDFGVREHIRFETDVREAAWDDEALRWRLNTSAGRATARVLVPGVGGHSAPHVPELPGREAFAGRSFHSVRWPRGFDPSGERVAVVGTGASAVQLVPALAGRVQHLTLFQRTPPWVIPHGDRPIPERAQRLFQRFPRLMRAWRRLLFEAREASGLLFRHPRLARLAEPLARGYLRRQIPDDPALRDVLTPAYTLGCKRILHSDDYYPALTRPDVTVVDGAAAALAPCGVAGPAGAVHPADAVVFCTGSRITETPFADRVRGREGRSLRAAWTPTARAHLGTTVAGFPNLFYLRGPNTGLGHNSVLPMIEIQIEHLLGALRFMQARAAPAVEPRRAAQAAFAREVDRRTRGTVWTSGGCDSWYLDETGRNATLWPGSVRAFRRRAAAFDPAEYRHLKAPRSKRHADDESHAVDAPRERAALAAG